MNDNSHIDMGQVKKDVLKFTDAYFNDDFDKVSWRINGLLDWGQPAIVPLLYASRLVEAYSKGKKAYQDAIGNISNHDPDGIEAKLPEIMDFSKRADINDYNTSVRSFPKQANFLINKILKESSEHEAIAKSSSLTLKVFGSTLNEIALLRKKGDFEAAYGLEGVLRLLIEVFPNALDSLPLGKLKPESRQALDRLIGDMNESRGAGDKLVLLPESWLKRFPAIKNPIKSLLPGKKGIGGFLRN